MFDEDLGFCWANFGNGLSNFENCLSNSISEFHPNSKQLACNFPNVASKIVEIRQNHSFYAKSPGALKILFFPMGIKRLDTNWVAFCDKDMVLRRRLDPIIDSAEEAGIDIILTVRNDSRFLNTGFMIVKNGPQIHKTLAEWNETLIDRLHSSATDDQVLINILKLHRERFSNLFLEVQDSNFAEFLDIDELGYKIRLYTTRTLNNSDPYNSLPDDSFVQHFKGIQFLLIERNFLDYRFYSALVKLTLISKIEFKEIVSKIILWHRFQNQPHFILNAKSLKVVELFRFIFSPARFIFPNITNFFK